MSIYIAFVDIDPGVLAKMSTKHHITEAEVRESLMWPAAVTAAFDDDPEHGPRWVARATSAEGREFFAALLPLPPHDEELAEVWLVKTAYWLDA